MAGDDSYFVDVRTNALQAAAEAEAAFTQIGTAIERLSALLNRPFANPLSNLRVSQASRDELNQVAGQLQAVRNLTQDGGNPTGLKLGLNQGEVAQLRAVADQMAQLARLREEMQKGVIGPATQRYAGRPASSAGLPQQYEAPRLLKVSEGITGASTLRQMEESDQRLTQSALRLAAAQDQAAAATVRVTESTRLQEARQRATAEGRAATAESRRLQVEQDRADILQKRADRVTRGQEYRANQTRVQEPEFAELDAYREQSRRDAQEASTKAEDRRAQAVRQRAQLEEEAYREDVRRTNYNNQTPEQRAAGQARVTETAQRTLAADSRFGIRGEGNRVTELTGSLDEMAAKRDAVSAAYDDLRASGASESEARRRASLAVERGAQIEVDSQAASAQRLNASGLSQRALGREVETLQSLSQAELRLLAATARLEEARAAQANVNRQGGQKGTDGQVLKANQAVVDAERDQRAAAGGVGKGGIGNFAGGVGAGLFDTGGGGFFSRDNGEALGFTFRYVAYYQAFIELSRAAQVAREETAAYERAVTNLSITLGTSRGEARGFADSLGAISTANGLAPSEGVNYGATFARAFSGEAPKEELARAGTLAGASLYAVSQQKDPIAGTQKDLQSTVAILKNFELQATGTARALDVATSAAQNFGFAGAEDILPGFAKVSDLAKEAGFTIEETANLIGLIRQRTGDTSEAAADQLRRVFGSQGVKSFEAVFDQYGVSSQQDLAGKFKDLSAIFPTLKQDERSRIVSTFGGDRASAATQALLSEYQAVEDGAEKSANAQGLLQEQANLKLNDLTGRLKVISAQYKELGKDIGESGLGAGIGAILSLVSPLLQGLDGIVKAFNEIGRSAGPLKEPAIALAEILLLVKLIKTETGIALLGNLAGAGVARGAGGIGSSAAYGAVGAAGTVDIAARLSGGGAPVRPGVKDTLFGKGPAPAFSNSAIVGALGGVETKAGAAAAAMGGLINPITLAIGALIIFGGTLGALQKQEEARKTIDDADAAYLKITDSASAAAVASQYGTGSEQVKGASKGFFGTLGVGADFLRGNNAAEEYNQAERRKEQTKALSERLLIGQGGETSQSVFGAQFENLENGLRGMTEAGVPAARQMQLVAEALGLLGENASTDVKATPTNLLAAVNAGLAGTYEGFSAPTFKNGVFTPGTTATSSSVSSAGFTNDEAPEVQKLAEEEAKKLGLNEKSVLTPGARKLLATAVAERLIPGIGMNQATVDAARAAFIESFSKGVQAQADALSNKPAPTSAEFDLLISGGVDASSIAGSANPLDSDAAEKGIRQFIGVAKRVGVDNLSEQGLAAYNQAVSDLDAIIIERLEKKRKALQEAEKPGTSAFKLIGQRFLRKEAKVLAKNDDVVGLKAIFEAANRKEIDDIVGLFRREVELAKLEVLVAEGQAKRAALLANPTLAGVQVQKVGDAAKDKADSALARAQANLKNVETAADQAAAPATGGDYSGSAAEDADTKKKEAEAREIARLQSQADSRSPISQARTSLRVAEYQLSVAKKNSAEYYGALKAVRDAQVELAKAEADYAKNKAILGSDITDPLEQARIDLAAARRQLRNDADAPADTRAADRVAVRRARAEVEKAKFDRRFDDANTNYDLGRISFQAYMRYLDSEHDRLTAIKKRTRQQQEELNQIDAAIKAANEAVSGQFNLGDIKVPTVYEARRAATEAAAGARAANTTTANITINGANMTQVAALFSQYFGPAAASAVTVSHSSKG